MTKVLYIEDNDDNVYMLKMRLELRTRQHIATIELGCVSSELIRMKDRHKYPKACCYSAWVLLH